MNFYLPKTYCVNDFIHVGLIINVKYVRQQSYHIACSSTNGLLVGMSTVKLPNANVTHLMLCHVTSWLVNPLDPTEFHSNMWYFPMISRNFLKISPKFEARRPIHIQRLSECKPMGP